MGLPTIAVPEYTLTIPSTGKETKFRPFLVKEEKILLSRQKWKFQDGTPDESNFTGWDSMTQVQKNMVNEWYRLQGPSKSGGAFHHK